MAKAKRNVKKKSLNTKVIVLVLAVIIVGAGVFMFLSGPKADQKDYSTLTKCLTDKGVFMYGSITCNVCKREREYLGPAMQYVKEIECNARSPNSQVELCLARGIEKTPTWILEKDGQELKRLEGFQDAAALADLGGCPVE